MVRKTLRYVSLALLIITFIFSIISFSKYIKTKSDKYDLINNNYSPSKKIEMQTELGNTKSSIITFSVIIFFGITSSIVTYALSYAFKDISNADLNKRYR